jgi:hypothetical protein
MSLKPPNQIVMGKNMGQALVRLSIAFFAHFYTGKHANNRRINNKKTHIYFSSQNKNVGTGPQFLFLQTLQMM